MPGSMLNSTTGSTMNPRRGIFTLFVLLWISVRLASASATLLLEEPYGKLGFFTATGHAAVYLSDVCAETPLTLRPCARGELGAVISRYDGVGGYDWVAIPLIPYLYAVEKPEQIPLFVDGKVVNFLRDRYRRNHLEAVAPDLDGGQTPSGNWYELVGSAYDRASYAFEIETSTAQDRAFIRSYNSAPNVSHFHIVSRNCADFAKDVINFYYPKALHRSVVADVGMTTPKQMAKTLVKFSTRHSELQFTRYVIPQVPGIEARSSAVHGVVESFLKSKKYFVPSIAASPIFAGCVAAVYVGSGAGRFHPGRDAPIFDAEGGLSPAIGEEDRRSYQTELNHLLTIEMAQAGLTVEKDLERTMSSGAPGFDSLGRPVLRMQINDESETVGVAKGNVLAIASTGQIAQRLLEARLHEELRKGESPKVSAGDVERDWKLLQAAFSVFDDRTAKQLFGASTVREQTRLEVAGNRP
jgi:hypothetical protein